MPQYGEVIGQQGDKDVGAEVVAVFLREADAAGVRGMVHDMDEQTHEAVDEVFPSAGFFGEAAFQQIAIDFGEGHDCSSSKK
jgi:hypothetical protein